MTALHLFLFDRKRPWTVVINMSGCVTPVWSCNSWWLNAWFCGIPRYNWHEQSHEERKQVDFFFFFNHPTFSLLDEFWDMFNHNIFILAFILRQFFPAVILNRYCCVLMVEFNTFQCLFFFCHQYPAQPCYMLVLLVSVKVSVAREDVLEVIAHVYVWTCDVCSSSENAPHWFGELSNGLLLTQKVMAGFLALHTGRRRLKKITPLSLYLSCIYYY